MSDTTRPLRATRRMLLLVAGSIMGVIACRAIMNSAPTSSRLPWLEVTVANLVRGVLLPIEFCLRALAVTALALVSVGVTRRIARLSSLDYQALILRQIGRLNPPKCRAVEWILSTTTFLCLWGRFGIAWDEPLTVVGSFLCSVVVYVFASRALRAIGHGSHNARSGRPHRAVRDQR
jgi:hypothetical protein